jgi:acetyltransferase-like isoleucine patch superfamily enzyme
MRQLLKAVVSPVLRRLPIGLRCAIQSLRARGRMVVGAGSYVHGSVHVLGRSNVRIGANSCISDGSWLNVNHRVAGQVAIDIGRSCFIGKHNFFTSGRAISVGDFTLTAIGCKFIGSSHVIDDPRVPCLFSGTTSTDEMHIGAGCFIGAGATILGHVRVGHGSVVGANAMVTSDIPPFSLAVGHPARVVKRYSFVASEWRACELITEEDVAAMPTEAAHVAHLMVNYAHLEMPWIAAGRSLGQL